MSSSTLETFPNPRPERDYEIAISCPEFTSVCPKTGLPDFGEIRITYVPDARCVELKSLKYYLIEFRNRGIFYEHVTNQILDDLVAALQPRRMTVVGDFSVRGGIKTVVTATYVEPRPCELADLADDWHCQSDRVDPRFPSRPSSISTRSPRATSLSVVDEYVDAAAAAGFREVRLVHGRGRGVQRATVQAALERHAAWCSNSGTIPRRIWARRSRGSALTGNKSVSSVEALVPSPSKDRLARRRPPDGARAFRWRRAGSPAEVPTPEAHFGFRMGADRPPGAADGIEQYFEAVASQSDRVQDRRPRTDDRRPPDDRRHRQRAREHHRISSGFARPTSVWPIRARSRPTRRARSSPRTRRSLAIGGSIHASEIGATQAANELLYWLATTERRRRPSTPCTTSS